MYLPGLKKKNGSSCCDVLMKKSQIFVDRVWKNFYNINNGKGVIGADMRSFVNILVRLHLALLEMMRLIRGNATGESHLFLS